MKFTLNFLLHALFISLGKVLILFSARFLHFFIQIIGEPNNLRSLEVLSLESGYLDQAFHLVQPIIHMLTELLDLLVGFGNGSQQNLLITGRNEWFPIVDPDAHGQDVDSKGHPQPNGA